MNFFCPAGFKLLLFAVIAFSPVQKIKKIVQTYGGVVVAMGNNVRAVVVSIFCLCGHSAGGAAEGKATVSINLTRPIGKTASGHVGLVFDGYTADQHDPVSPGITPAS